MVTSIRDCWDTTYYTVLHHATLCLVPPLSLLLTVNSCSNTLQQHIIHYDMLMYDLSCIIHELRYSYPYPSPTLANKEYTKSINFTLYRHVLQT